MASLLIDLFKYRSREKREAMEDWLTECLAALMRALSDQQFAELIKGITGQDCRNLLASGAKREIVTQYAIPSSIDDAKSAAGAGQRAPKHRPDMVVFIGGDAWLLFENKVAHSVDESRSNDARYSSQLHRYGKWLQRSEFTEPELKKSLVFVTHHTLPPSDFAADRTDAPGFEGLERHIATWGSVGRCLERVAASYEGPNHVRFLVDCYNQFLEEHGLANEYPDSKNIALLGVQIGALDGLQKLVEDMFARVENIGSWNGNKYTEVDAQYGRFAKKRWVNLPEGWPEDSWIMAGLWYPDSPDQLYRAEIDGELAKAGKSPVTSAPKVFLLLAHKDDDMFPRPDTSPSSEWFRPVSDFIAFRDFDSFHGDPAKRAVAIFAWLDERVVELREFVEA